MVIELLSREGHYWNVVSMPLKSDKTAKKYMKNTSHIRTEAITQITDVFYFLYRSSLCIAYNWGCNSKCAGHHRSYLDINNHY